MAQPALASGGNGARIRGDRRRRGRDLALRGLQVGAGIDQNMQVVFNAAADLVAKGFDFVCHGALGADKAFALREHIHQALQEFRITRSVMDIAGRLNNLPGFLINLLRLGLGALVAGVPMLRWGVKLFGIPVYFSSSQPAKK